MSERCTYCDSVEDRWLCDHYLVLHARWRKAANAWAEMRKHVPFGELRTEAASYCHDLEAIKNLSNAEHRACAQEMYDARVVIQADEARRRMAQEAKDKP